MITINDFFSLTIYEIEDLVWKCCEGDLWNIRIKARYSRFSSITKHIMECLNIVGKPCNKESRLCKRNNVPGLFFITQSWDEDWEKSYNLHFSCLKDKFVQLDFDINTGKVIEIETTLYDFIASSIDKNKSLLWYLNH